ncbi:MAG TPA: sigma-54 dependent transcriptional regulator [Phycisphaerae bacterium]|nr:sigma-54 dependent transcriptional regulator [Phycisphaerae bacterium]HRW54951.1 sigma-54 dependent transcriptional regulator [Phycisphaerae bacterium]
MAGTNTDNKANVQSKQKVLIVDDDRIIVDSLSELLEIEGYDVIGANSVGAAVEAIERDRVAIVITDVNMPEADGFELLNIIRDRYPAVVPIVITGYGTIESAVEAIKMGAYDYLTKPIIDDELRLVIQRALQQQSLIRENHSLRQQLDLRYGLDNVVGHDYRMLKIFDLVETVSDTKTTVLITGESGTGKTLIAHALHHRSDRREGPFVEVSCGAIPEGLLESELFGHVKGSFTGATGDKEGKFRAAEGGTIFLDEINSASAAFQVKLLRVLQDKCFEPVGSNKTLKADVRVIVASNVDLAEEVAAGRFRQDLYYRINVVTIAMPSLVERLGDIPMLARHFLRKHCDEIGRDIHDFSPDAINAMQRYSWPGNVRELENAVERAVVLCRERFITPTQLPAHILEDTPQIMATTSTDQTNVIMIPSQVRPLREALEEPEKRIIEAALRAHNWNRQATADALDINRTTLYKKMKHYGLDAEPAMAGHV